MTRRSLVAVALVAGTVAVSAQPPRHPDLQGTWTNATLTPLQRPPEFAAKPFFTAAEAAEWERNAMEWFLRVLPQEDREMGADLNDIYLETNTMKVLPDRRTSLIVDPDDGKLPLQLPQAVERAKQRPKRGFDDPETLSFDERCLLGTTAGGSSVAAPIVPNVFAQNYYQIVQTNAYVMIFTELVHDARVIRINGTHPPDSIRSWLGDSTGRWEGDTLVVDTTNFTAKTHWAGSSDRLHVVERFTRIDAKTIRYRATVEDPETWGRAWTVEFPFTTTDKRIFEYACHEGNRAIENFLRGARAEERRKSQ